MTRSSSKKTSTKTSVSATQSSTAPISSATVRTLPTATAAAAVTAPAPKPKPTSRIPAPPPRETDNIKVEAAGPEMKKQELLQKVVDLSGIKKRDAKPVVEAMLSVLGAALAEGRELDLQPFGKVMLTRSNEKANARVLFARIRQSKKQMAADKDTVAVDVE